jgi:hypothetical protein
MPGSVAVWQTYHEADQLRRFGLGGGYHIPFFVNETPEEENINGMNRMLSELVTLWYVWKNWKKTDIVGFESYRRRLDLSYLPATPKEGQIFIYDIYDFWPNTVYGQYASCFGTKSIDAALSALDDLQGTGNPYTDNIRNSTRLIGNCCFMVDWDSFVKLCEFMFPVLELTMNKLGFEYSESGYYEALGRSLYENNGMFMRSFGHIGERLISAWIFSNFEERNIIKRHKEIMT